MRFDSQSVQIAFVLNPNDRLNKEQEEEHTEREIKPRGSKKIMCSRIVRRISMAKKPLKKRNVCKQNPVLRVQYCWRKMRQNVASFVRTLNNY
jgi:outer membrane lipopolysaccharide assembly protein LptE/RlpB